MEVAKWGIILIRVPVILEKGLPTIKLFLVSIFSSGPFVGADDDDGGAGGGLESEVSRRRIRSLFLIIVWWC